MFHTNGLTQMELLKLGEQLRDGAGVAHKLALYAQAVQDHDLAQLLRSHQVMQQRHVHVVQSYVDAARQGVGQGAGTGQFAGAGQLGAAGAGGRDDAGRGFAAGGHGPAYATAPVYGGQTGPAHGGWQTGGRGQPWTAGDADLGRGAEAGGATYGYTGGVRTEPGYGNDTGYARAGPAAGVHRYEVGDLEGTVDPGREFGHGREADAGDGDRDDRGRAPGRDGDE